MNNRKHIARLLLCSALTSPAAFAGAPLEAAQDITPFSVSSADRQLNENVIQQLTADQKLRGNIAVSSQRGHVMLRGKVEDVVMIYRSVEQLRRVEGVKSIDVSQLDT